MPQTSSSTPSIPSIARSSLPTARWCRRISNPIRASRRWSRPTAAPPAPERSDHNPSDAILKRRLAELRWGPELWGLAEHVEGVPGPWLGNRSVQPRRAQIPERARSARIGAEIAAAIALIAANAIDERGTGSAAVEYPS